MGYKKIKMIEKNVKEQFKQILEYGYQRENESTDFNSELIQELSVKLRNILNNSIDNH